MRTAEQFASWMETVAVINIYIQRKNEELNHESDRDLQIKIQREVEQKSLEVKNALMY